MVVKQYQPQNVVSYDYQMYEDNRPMKWRVTLAPVEGYQVDEWDARDEFEIKRTVITTTTF